MITFIDLFAGIGGFSLGFERAGLKCIGQVEKNEFCIKVLEKYWPNVKKIRDIKNVRKGDFERPYVISAGYPCQPDSSAGKRRGTKDDRWLWPETCHIVEEYRPSWFIGENVINHENMGLKVVISDLESIRYQVRPFIIPNAACQLQTVERHIWIIATPVSERFKRCETDTNSYIGKTWKFQGADKRIEDGWNLPESRVCRTRKGFPDWMDRIIALGNAVPPQIPEIIGRMILEIER